MNATALAMPSLAGIPRAIEHHRGGTFAARLALALDDVGLFEPTLRDRGRDDELVGRVLKRWWAGKFDGLQVLQASLQVTEVRGSEVFSGHGAEMAITAWPTDQGPERMRQLKARCTELEGRVPGLGETAVAWLDQGLAACALDCLTPRFALHCCAAHCWWHGESDERMAIEDIVANGEDPAELEIYRRADFFKAAPEWTVEAKKRLSLARLKLLARREPVAAACLAVNAAIKKAGRPLWHVMERIEDAETCGIATAILWSRDDDCVRLYDDYANDMVNGGGDQALFAFRVDADPRAIAEALAKIDRAMDVARAVDALAMLITDPVRL